MALVWTGPFKAYGRNWNYDNADYVAEFAVNGGATSFNLLAGQALPVTVFFGNGGGPGAANYIVTTPNAGALGFER